MFDKFKQSIQQAGDVIKEQAASIGDAAKEKGYQIIETWISTIPKLEAYGFKTTFFSLSVSINPTLEVEMQAPPAKFEMDRINEILKENKDSTPVNLVFTAIKTTKQLHTRSRVALLSPLTVRISVRFSPEVRVSYGKPIVD
ncbi:MAG: hypothetical protein H6577_13695 [Lewinellaceae bacterium]|nr:hypothetical protein [Saprospiraceae bacterium]MCB9339179.1 hypothetical protein [Lewinellaceae bacterium]